MDGVALAERWVVDERSGNRESARDGGRETVGGRRERRRRWVVGRFFVGSGEDGVRARSRATHGNELRKMNDAENDSLQRVSFLLSLSL